MLQPVVMDDGIDDFFLESRHRLPGEIIVITGRPKKTDDLGMLLPEAFASG